MAVILCIEDEAALRRDLADELREAGYEVLEASDGASGLQAMIGARPDLVLCDITMPHMSGYEVLREVRQRHPELADTPFIFLTALADRKHVIEGKLRGADDYLTKPIDFDLMLATIETRLKQIGRLRAQHEATRAEQEASLLESLKQGADERVRNAIKVFDFIQIGVAIIEPSRQVAHFNEYAARIVEQRDGLSIQNGALVGSASLREHIDAAFDASQGAQPNLPIVIDLPRPSGKRPLVVSIFTLKPIAAADPGDRTMAAVLISDPEDRRVVPAELLGRLYGFTAAETRVALALMQGHDLKDIAGTYGVSEGTVRHQLKAIFAKTDTHRQAELVALLGRVCQAFGTAPSATP